MKHSPRMATAGLVLAWPALAQSASDVSEKDRQAIDVLAREFASDFNSKNVAGVVAMHTSEAVYITQTGLFQGSAAIAAVEEQQMKAGIHDLSITPKIYRALGDDVWAGGDWSATAGDQPVHGFWSNNFVRDGVSFKITMRTDIFVPPPSPK